LEATHPKSHLGCTILPYKQKHYQTSSRKEFSREARAPRRFILPRFWDGREGVHDMRCAGSEGFPFRKSKQHFAKCRRRRLQRHDYAAEPPWLCTKLLRGRGGFCMLIHTHTQTHTYHAHLISCTHSCLSEVHHPEDRLGLAVLN